MDDPLGKITREDLWDWAGSLRYELGYAGAHTGVVLPQDFSMGQVLESGYARRVAAALILAADMHDRIYDRGWNDRGIARESARATVQSQADRLQELHELLGEVHAFLEDLDTTTADRGVRVPGLSAVKRRVNEERAR